MSKKILLVSSTDFSDQVYEALENIQALGHRLYLLSGFIDSRPGVFDRHFKYDLRKTKETLEYMKEQDIEFDAVTMQFSDLLTPLVALLAREFGCIGNDPVTAFHCRSKYHMRQKLQEMGVPGPNFRLCRNYDELRDAVDEIGFPCIAKPIGLSASYGVFAIMNESGMTDLKTNYENSINFLRQKVEDEDIFEFSPEECELMGIKEWVSTTTDYLVEEFMDGPEISVDALVQNGRVSIMGIEEQIRMKPPYFIQLAARLPYLASAGQLAEIEELVTRTIKAMGIENSATHTEIIFTDEGPKVVEIGCRIGGDDLHESILEVTGYSLVHEAIMIALGIKRNYTIKHRCHTAMEYLLPAKSGVVSEVRIDPALQYDPDVNGVTVAIKKGDRVSPPPFSFDPLGYVSVKGKTPERCAK